MWERRKTSPTTKEVSMIQSLLVIEDMCYFPIQIEILHTRAAAMSTLEKACLGQIIGPLLHLLGLVLKLRARTPDIYQPYLTWMRNPSYHPESRQCLEKNFKVQQLDCSNIEHPSCRRFMAIPDDFI